MNDTNPNFGISIFPFADTDYDYTTIWASYSEAFRTPSGNERFMPGWLGGNPNLKPEKSKGYEIGLKQDFWGYGNLEISYFNTKYEDMIRLVQLGLWDYLFKNEDEATYNGVEIGAEIYPTDWLGLYTSYTKSKRENDITGKRIYGQPDSTFKYGFVISNLKDFKGFEFSLQARQYSDFKFSRTGKTHPANNKTMLDARAAYEFGYKNLSIMPYIVVENLGNVNSYGTAGDNPYLLEKRSFTAGMNIKYNF